jgi:parallel beta-helix repeat protein
VLVPPSSSGGGQIQGTNVRSAGATGNGSFDDTAAITAAVTLAAAGGTVLFPPGTYLTTGLTAAVTDQAWILSPGATILLKAGSTVSVVSVAAAGVTLTGGGTIDGNQANITSPSPAGIYNGASANTDLTVDGITIQNTISSGMVSFASRTVARNCKVLNCSAGMTANVPAIQVSTVDSPIYSCVIRDNVVDSSGLSASLIAGSLIYLGGGSRVGGSRAYVYNALECNIDGNAVIAPVNPTNVSGDVICIGVGAESSLCANNTTRGGSMGISADTADNTVVAGNTIYGPNWYGIEIPNTIGLVVDGNTINGNGLIGTHGSGAGIELDGNYGSGSIQVTNNRIVDYLAAGIALNTGSQHIVSGNVVDSSGAGTSGIIVQATEWTIVGNVLLGPSFTTTRGVYLANTTGKGSIVGNVIANWTHGIDLAPTSVVTDYVTITGNTFAGNTVAVSENASGEGSIGSNIRVSANPGVTDQ